LSEVLRQATPALGYLVTRAGERGDLNSPQGKAKALASLLGFVLRVGDRVERAEWIGRIADALRIEQHLVERSFDELRRQPRRAPYESDEPAERSLPSVAAQLGAVPFAERRLLQALVHSPAWLADIDDIFDRTALRDPRVQAGVAAIEQLLAEFGTPDVVSPQRILEIADTPDLDRLLSRLTAEEDLVALPEARGCAFAIRRAELLRQFDELRRQIQQAEADGAAQLDELQHRHIALGQQIAELRLREQQLANG